MISALSHAANIIAYPYPRRGLSLAPTRGAYMICIWLFALIAVTALQFPLLASHVVLCIMHVCLRPVRPHGDEAAPQCTMHGTRGRHVFVGVCNVASLIAAVTPAIRRAILGLRLLYIHILLFALSSRAMTGRNVGRRPGASGARE